jgi:hypothetical protein
MGLDYIFIHLSMMELACDKQKLSAYLTLPTAGISRYGVIQNMAFSRRTKFSKDSLITIEPFSRI